MTMLKKKQQKNPHHQKSTTKTHNTKRQDLWLHTQQHFILRLTPIIWLVSEAVNVSSLPVTYAKTKSTAK